MSWSTTRSSLEFYPDENPLDPESAHSEHWYDEMLGWLGPLVGLTAPPR